MTDRRTMDLAERRVADRTLAERRQTARRDYVRYAEEEAAADREYTKTLARVFLEHRDKGEPVGASELLAKAEAAEAKQRRDIAHSLARAALLRIDETEREAVTVRDIHSSSERVDGVTP